MSRQLFNSQSHNSSATLCTIKTRPIFAAYAKDSYIHGTAPCTIFNNSIDAQFYVSVCYYIRSARH